MFPKDWAPPCGSCCTKKYSGLLQIPWRVFCKKGCDADAETWDECVEECNEICYKDPVLKDHQWSAYIDRSPGEDSYSLFDIPEKEVEAVKPNRPPKPAPVRKQPPRRASPITTPDDDLPTTSA